MTGVLQEKGERDLRRRNPEKAAVADRRRAASYAAPVMENQEAAEADRGKDTFSAVVFPACDPIKALLSDSGTVGEYISVVLRHQVSGSLFQQPWKRIQTAGSLWEII